MTDTGGLLSGLKGWHRRAAIVWFGLITGGFVTVVTGPHWLCIACWVGFFVFPPLASWIAGEKDDRASRPEEPWEGWAP